MSQGLLAAADGSGSGELAGQAGLVGRRAAGGGRQEGGGGGRQVPAHCHCCCCAYACLMYLAQKAAKVKISSASRRLASRRRLG